MTEAQREAPNYILQERPEPVAEAIQRTRDKIAACFRGARKVRAALQEGGEG